MDDILDNHTTDITIDDRIFESENIECYELQNREELDMFFICLFGLLYCKQ